jgi:serine/threonine-protein kinase HipA
MYKPVSVVQVLCWDELVGAVALDAQSGFYAFQYAPEWLRSGFELSPLKLRKDTQPHTFPLLPIDTYQRLPALLADALPDRFGNALIDAYLADKGVKASSITALDRLAYMGERAMGALSFKPGRGPRHTKPTAIELSSLVSKARSVLTGNFNGDHTTMATLANLIQVGTSAGGARAKAVIAFNPNTKEIRSGQLPADPGFEHWLLKFDGVGEDKALGEGGHYGRIEFAYGLMAAAAGIDMPLVNLIEENGRAHFMIKRFDRGAAGRVHMQSLCAISHLDYNQRGTHSYNQLFQTIDDLGLGPSAMQEAFRRMVFNVAAANCDDHTKNLSFLMDRDGRWSLAPAYDVTHAYNPSGNWTYQHLMSVNGKFRDITRQDCLALADRWMVRNAKDSIHQVRLALQNWQVYASKAGIPDALARSIESDFVKI